MIFFMSLDQREIEHVFKTSNSPDELFDVFRIAIDSKIKDLELYKTLLWNKALSADEIIMFGEKICSEFPDFAFRIYLWIGDIFETTSIYGEYYNKAFDYYLKASKKNPCDHEPIISICNMFNKELNIPKLEKVIKVCHDALNNLELKSAVCFALAKIYRNMGDIENFKTYMQMGEKFQREGS